MRNEMKIDTTVTLPDGNMVSMSVSINDELYTRSEVPPIIEDIMLRSARAINKRLQEMNCEN